ncbi:HNH endonuclease [Haloarcula argentinensis]|uniref:HNH endonuclease n=1 Tax=Haloarcula argentinensis TaxID=43776 RepID=A0ABU2F629_HALAR|nr:HNH endonuclease [Haloarcula argentinensis]MDS0256040.1 HNH endonuclease [Haloarcula argentinensis]
MSPSDGDSNQSGDVNCPSCDRSFSTLQGMRSHHTQVHGESIAGTEVECAGCGDKTVVKPYRAEKHDVHYCGHDCRRDRLDVECAWCGTSMEVFPKDDRRNDHHFCRHECYAMWKSENLVGEDSPAWKGGYTKDRGTNWPKLREKALQAGGYQCQGCGMTEDEHREEHGVGLSVHHIRPVTEFDEPADADTVDNLVPLCRGCHLEWEGIPLRPELTD